MKLKLLLSFVFLFVLLILNKYNIINLKSIINENINIRQICKLYHYNYINDDIAVSAINKIYVKKIETKNNYLNIYPLNNKILSPIEGLVIKAIDDSIIIQGEDNINYIFYNIDRKNVLIYTYVLYNDVIGYDNSYFSISTNSNINLGEYLNYEEFNEVI